MADNGQRGNKDGRTLGQSNSDWHGVIHTGTPPSTNPHCDKCPK